MVSAAGFRGWKGRYLELRSVAERGSNDCAAAGASRCSDRMRSQSRCDTVTFLLSSKFCMWTNYCAWDRRDTFMDGLCSTAQALALLPSSCQQFRFLLESDLISSVQRGGVRNYTNHVTFAVRLLVFACSVASGRRLTMIGALESRVRCS